MRERTRLVTLVVVMLALFGCFGYLCWRQGQEKRVMCPCSMAKNRECPLPGARPSPDPRM